MFSTDGEININVNQTLRSTEGKFYRVLWVDNEGIYWISLDPPKNTPERISLNDLKLLLDTGTVSYAMFPPFSRPVFKNEEAAFARRDRIWKIIEKIVSSEPQVFSKQLRGIMLKDAEKTYGVKQNNLYGYLGKYWRSGKNKDSLLPDYKNVGCFKDKYGDSTKRPGRKNTNGAPGGKIQLADLAIFEKAYKELYLTKKYRTLHDTYTAMLRLYYTERDKNGNYIKDLPPEKVPSMGQFYYWHAKTKSKTEEAREQKDEKKYNLENRGGTGTTETHLYGPCALCQIDATIADIYLVRQSDRHAIIGRPTVYFVIDAYSHIIQGLHVSLEKPSWDQAAMALLNAAEDKVEFCAKYGIEIKPEDWPCRSIPSAIRGDRGEMAGYAVEEIIRSLNITIQNTPPYRGDLKGIVESLFKVANYVYAGVPGYVEDDFGERCTADYRLDSILDINQFTAILILLVLYHNNNVYMKDYTKTLDMRQHNVKPIARDIWNYGIQYKSGAQRMISKEELRALFLPKGTASITRKGIQFEGRYYTCKQAEDEHWFDKARTEGREQIEIRYDSRDSTFIYIRYGNENQPIECHLVDYMEEYGALSEEELKVLRKLDSEEEKRETYNQDRAKGRMLEQIEQIVTAAANAKASEPKTGKTKAQRLEEIRSNTLTEIEAQRANATARSSENVKKSIFQDNQPNNESIDTEDNTKESSQSSAQNLQGNKLPEINVSTDPLEEALQKVFEEMEERKR